MEGKLFVEKTGYITDIVPALSEKIKENAAVVIVAPTGSGKTTGLTGCVNKKKCYPGFIDHFPNSIILVPFNTTGRLYDGPGVNLVASHNINKFKKGKCNAMVIDQFNKHIGEIIANPPEVVFIDESHELFFGPTYRNACEECQRHLLNLKTMGVKIVLISATPAGEVGLFGAKTIKINRKDNRNIVFEFIHCKDTYSSIINDMKTYEYEGFDRLAIFSDRDCNALFEWGIGADKDINICHSKYRENVDQLVDTELLNHDITTMTSIAYNGLNIRNTGEKILVAVRYVYGENNINQLIQIPGRFRANHDITIRVYFDGVLDKKSVNSAMNDLNRDFNDAQIILANNAEEFKTEYYERIVDPGIYSSVAAVLMYNLQWTVKNLTGHLTHEGYKVVIRDESGMVSPEKHIRPIKKEASDKFRVDYVNDVKTESDDKYLMAYVNVWLRRINKLKALYNPDKIDEALKELFTHKNRNGKDNSLNVESHITNLEDALKIWSMDDVEWAGWLSVRNNILKDPRASKNLKDKVRKIIKRNDSLREKYKGWNFEDVLQGVLGDQVDLLMKFLDGNALGGKNSARVLFDTRNNCFYESCKDASKKLGCSSTTITRMIKNGTLVKQ